MFSRDDFYFTEHAVDRMAERGLLVSDVIDTVATGEVIETNAADRPFPSVLSFKVVAGLPVHVAWATNPQTGAIVVITTYVPDMERWSADFRTRRKQS